MLFTSVGLILTCLVGNRSFDARTDFLVMKFKKYLRSFEQFDFMTLGDFEHKFAQIRNDM